MFETKTKLEGTFADKGINEGDTVRVWLVGGDRVTVESTCVDDDGDLDVSHPYLGDLCLAIGRVTHFAIVKRAPQKYSAEFGGVPINVQGVDSIHVRGNLVSWNMLMAIEILIGDMDLCDTDMSPADFHRELTRGHRVTLTDETLRVGCVEMSLAAVRRALKWIDECVS